MADDDRLKAPPTLACVISDQNYTFWPIREATKDYVINIPSVELAKKW